MYTNNAYNAYKSNSIMHASKEQLLLMLLDGAVKFSKMGRQAIVDKEIQKAHDNITRTQDIFYELMATLDVEKAGDWGEPTLRIYEFIVRRLGEGNMKKDVQIIDEVLPLIEEIRDTWYEVEKRAKGMK